MDGSLPANPRHFDLLLKQLGSVERAERWTAQREVRELTPADLESLVPQILRLHLIRQQSGFTLLLGIFAFPIVLLGLLLLFDAVFGRVSHGPVFLSGIAGGGLAVRRWFLQRQRISRTLNSLTDSRLVAPLADVVHYGSAAQKVVALALLQRLIPRLRPTDLASLTPTQRDTLQSLEPDRKAAPISVA